MPISPRQFNQIVSSLREKFSSSFSSLDTKEGSTSRIGIIDPTSLELEEIESLLLEVQESQNLLTASGVDLDLLAFNYNVQRRGAQFASGFVQFFVYQSILTDPIFIEKDTVISSIENVEYSTLLDGTINGFSQLVTRNSQPAYQITIPVVSLSSGIVGNASAFQVNTVNITNVNVTNDSPIEGGFEEETDDSLAQRSILSFGVWSRGTKKAVEFGARLIPGVYYARAVTDYAGHFNIYVSDQAGNLPDEMRQEVFNIMVDWAGSGNGWSVLAPPIFYQDTLVKVIFKSKVNMTTQINQLIQDVATVINRSNDSTIYIEQLYADLQTQIGSYVLHFDLENPSDHIIQPVGTIIRSNSVSVINETV